MTLDARNDLDRAITRALQGGEVEQLRLLKSRQISATEFLGAARSNRLLALKPRHALRPLVDRWLEARDLRESSRARYRQSWRFLFNSLPPDGTTAAVTPDWWTEFVQSRGGVTTSTLNRDRAALLAFQAWARDRGYDVRDIRSQRLKEEPNRSDILSPDQVDAVRRVCRPDRWPFFWTLIETGARQGEVLNLRGVDIGMGEIVFRSQPGSKSRGRERREPVSLELAACLRMLAMLSSGGRLFPCCRTTVREWWDEICGAAGITGVTLHGIRATFITRALDDGVPAVEVQKLVGHADLSTTAKYYRNTAQNRSAADKIRKAIGIAKTMASGPGPSVSPSTTGDAHAGAGR